MEVTVLGSGGTWPRREGATSGYLVQHEGFTLWVDMGSGTLAQLQRYVGAFDVDAVFVSHVHPDHVVDIYPYFYARHFHPDRPLGLPLYTPPGVVERVAPLLSEDAVADLRRVFDLRVVEGAEAFEVGPFRARTAPMSHPVPTLGLRLEDTAGGAVAYSADTGPTDELVTLARAVNLFFCEATWDRPVEGAPPLHLTASEAGEHASRADAEQLYLTHIWPSNDLIAAAERASDAFTGPVVLAKEGLRVAT